MWWPPSEYRWHPLLKMTSKSSLIPLPVPRRNVWLAHTAPVLCSNTVNIGDARHGHKVNFAPGRISLGGNSPQNIYTLCPRKNGPRKHALKFSKLASFAQFQFNSMNICLLSIKLPILVKICPTVIEIWHSINGLKSLPFPEAWFLT